MIVHFCFVFTCFQVDMTALSQMKDSDLKDMGVPMVCICISVILACLHIHGDIYCKKGVPM